MDYHSLADMIKGQSLETISPYDTIRDACIMMASANVGALPVVNDQGGLVGMLSERDVIKRSVIVYRPSETSLVREAMTRDPEWLPPEASPFEAYRSMINGAFRHLPVCDHGKLVGIVSIRDFTPKSETILAKLRRSAGISPKKRAAVVPS